MVRTVSTLVFILAFSALLSCGGEVKSEGTRPTSGAIVRTSSPTMPPWVLKPPKDSTNVYFSGMSGRASDLSTAKSGASQNGIAQLVDYIGLRATHSMTAERKYEDMDNVSSFRKTLIDTIEGKSGANVNVDVADTYYQEYSDGTFVVYSLIVFPKSWVEKERARLAKLVSDQRQKATELLANADAAVLAGDPARAIDLCVNALVIAEKAAENQDLYDDAKSKITLALSGLAFKLDSIPNYAYIEGGSDPIRVMVMSGDKAVKGIPVSAMEKSNAATLTSSTGGVSDGNGQTVYEVAKLQTKVSNLTLRFTFGMQKFEAVKKLDQKFYTELENLQKSQNLEIPLKVGPEAHVKPTVVVILDLSSDSGQMKIKASMKFAQSLSVLLGEAGFNVLSVDIPDSILKRASMDDTFRDSVMGYLTEHYPEVKRVFWGMRTAEYRGKNVQDVEWVATRLIVSLIDVKTRKENRGLDISAKGFGLSKSQAFDNAEKELPREFAKKLVGF